MLPLTNEELKLHQDAAVCYICGQRDIRDICHYIDNYRGISHIICNLKFNAPHEIPIFFHNSSNYDYDFIINELANTFKGPLECLGENIETCKTSSVEVTLINMNIFHGKKYYHVIKAE